MLFVLHARTRAHSESGSEQERQAYHCEQIISPQSWTKLTAVLPDELQERDLALKMQWRSKAATTNHLKMRIASSKIELDLNNQLLDFMNESLEHA